MSRWREQHMWIIEGYTTEDIWTRGGAAPGRWMRVRFSYGTMAYVRGTLTPKMTLKQAMGNLKSWQRSSCDALRMRHVESGEVILAAIL